MIEVVAMMTGMKARMKIVKLTMTMMRSKIAKKLKMPMKPSPKKSMTLRLVLKSKMIAGNATN